MTEKIDVFAHVLLPQLKQEILKKAPELPEEMPFIQHPLLTDMAARRQAAQSGVRQVISYVNTNPEDYYSPEESAHLVATANEELLAVVSGNQDIFAGAVAMMPMNHIDAALGIIKDFVIKNPLVCGVQLFSRHLGKSIADPEFKPIIEACAKSNTPIWLHPVFDARKPDNNIIFSWEYEQTQAMLQLVEAGYFQEFPELKVIVHHAGAMVPYFAERINHILPDNLAQDFKKFYVDTALLGNSKALALAVDYFGVNHVLFGTDAPLGIAPAGATDEIIEAILELPIESAALDSIFKNNFETLVKR